MNRRELIPWAVLGASSLFFFLFNAIDNVDLSRLTFALGILMLAGSTSYLAHAILPRLRGLPREQVYRGSIILGTAMIITGLAGAFMLTHGVESKTRIVPFLDWMAILFAVGFSLWWVSIAHSTLSKQR